MKKSYLTIILIILAAFVVGVWLYSRMPAEMASHWNVNGEVDGYMPRFWGMFLMPILSLGMFLLFLLIPKIDPLKENIRKFRRYFDSFIVLLTVFLFYIYILSVSWNLGYRFNMGQFMVPAMGILFYYCGILVENAKRNWFVGIRTPWTLSSEAVWEKTHRLGGKLFKVAGVLAFLGVLFPDYSIYFVLVPVISFSVYAVCYSYFQYRKETKDKKPWV